jgi:squalene cyclase
LALAAAEKSGGLPTWIFDSDSRSALDESMRAYVELTASGGVHPDVVSNLVSGILMYEPKRYQDDLLRAATYLEAVQDVRGAWCSRWYAGPYYGTYRVVSALSHIAPDSKALKGGQDFVLHSQRPEGSWGESRNDPLATALAILTLTVLGMGMGDAAIERGILYLVGTQETDGSWPASPFISFPRSDGVGVHTYASRTITTAFCLKALLAAAVEVDED